MSNQIRISRLNLSSRPFRNRTLPWVTALAVAGLSVLALGYLLNNARVTRLEADKISADLIVAQKHENELMEKERQIGQQLPLDRKQLLASSKELVARKYFSWSWLMEDLESVLPSDSRVTRINVKDVSIQDGRLVANLDLSVLTRGYTDVTGMIEQMDRGGIFQSELLEQNLQRDDTKNLTEWTLRIVYRPRLGVPMASSETSATVALNGQGQGATR